MTPTHAPRGERGFTIIEMMISMVIMIGITGVIFSLVDPGKGAYRTQPEVSDMQQRLRVGSTFLNDDLVMAGAGAPAGGALLGSLMNFFAPVQPYRIGMIGSDVSAGVFFRDDVISVMYIPSNAPQTTLSAAMPNESSELKVNPQSSCPVGDELCGFKSGQRILIFDESGAYDDMTLTAVQTSSQHLQHNRSVAGNTLSKKYGAGAQVAQVVQRTYYRNATTNQLMYYDGDQRDEAVVDHVVGLAFEYFGDPRPPLMLKPVTDPSGPWTTYGPRPPALGVAVAGWPAGENCAFVVDGGTGTHGPRLPDLAPNAESLVVMTAQTLTDGPWCPNNAAPNRFDADLLRLRKIGVVMRVQVASTQLRGPAGVLFRNGGQATSGNTLVPDQEVRFEITPRNFNLGR